MAEHIDSRIKSRKSWANASSSPSAVAARRRRLRLKAERLGMEVPSDFALRRNPKAMTEDERLARVRGQDRRRHERDREKRNAATAENHKRNRDRYLAQRRQKRQENIEAAREAQRAYRLANRAKLVRQAAEWRAANPDYHRKWQKRFRQDNPSHEADKRRTDINYRLSSMLRSRLVCVIRGKGPKTSGAIDLCGCSLEELRAHIEAQFKPGMSWQNHKRDGWHLDHIRPIFTFDLSDAMQQRACFHYTNLRPLWAMDNLTRERASWRINAGSTVQRMST